MRLELSKREARRLALQCQGLLSRAPFGKGRNAALKALSRLGYVQIDTISVVERAHHHTLWSRVPNYEPGFLERLYQDRKVFEYWSHAAAFLPMEDYRFCQAMMARYREKTRHWYPRDRKLMNEVVARIEKEGPLMARDFASDHQSTGMWDWKPAKMALHELVMTGELMVAGRQGFQKIYDLPQRVLPDGLNTSKPTKAEFAEFLVRRVLTAHGLVAENEVTYLRSEWKATVAKAIARLLEQQALVSVEVSGKSYLAEPESLEQVPKRLGRRFISLISPFDNAVIQRKRLQNLFDFDYQTEIYYPVKKRVHGYFSMPVLWGDRFVGRIDPKADRKTKTLIVNNLMLEPPYDCQDEVLNPLAEAVREFAAFNGCDRIELPHRLPVCAKLKRLLEAETA